MDLQEKQQLDELRKNYSTTLEKLVADLTRANLIEAALSAKAELKKITSSITPRESSEPETFELAELKGGVPKDIKLLDAPKFAPPKPKDNLFADNAEWPLKVTIPSGDYQIEKPFSANPSAGGEVKFTEGSTFKGKGDKARLTFGKSVVVGEGIKFSDFNLKGDLGSQFYLKNCEFENMDIGKGGGWFGGEFMSKWQLLDCKFANTFKSKWESHLTGIKAVNTYFERIKFPSVKFHEKHEPNSWAEHEWATFYKCYFRKCEIPISVLSATQNCSFESCRFIEDEPAPVEFKARLKLTIYEKGCTWVVKELPENLVIQSSELD